MVRSFLPVFGLVLLDGCHFVEIAQVRLQFFVLVGGNDIAAIDRLVVGRQIGFDEVVANDSHSAIDEQQPVESGLSRQQISDGSASDIFIFSDVSTGANGGALAVSGGDFRVVGTVVTNQNLEL